MNDIACNIYSELFHGTYLHFLLISYPSHQLSLSYNKSVTVLREIMNAHALVDVVLILVVGGYARKSFCHQLLP
jgi:hypothetical protein